MVRRLDREDAILHQIHPLKLVTDVVAAGASTALLWRRRPLAGVLARYVPPMVASALVLSFADPDRLRPTPAGRYVLRHMPDGAVAVRFAGDTLMALAAWRRNGPGVAAGAVLVAVGWSHGLLAKLRTLLVLSVAAAEDTPEPLTDPA
jgi:hypothetical protein